MEAVKTTENVEFEVQYADGETRHVKEGLLFEFDKEKIVSHIGTNRQEAIFAIIEATMELITAMNTEEAFKKYMGIESPTKRGKEHENRIENK